MNINEALSIPDPDDRLPVVIVGPGRLGLSLALALAAAGWPPVALVTPEPARFNFPSPDLPPRPVLAPGHPLPPTDAGLVIISVPDDRLATAANELTAALPPGDAGGWIVLHTSGVHDHSILRPVADRGAATGSWHPMQSFVGADAAAFHEIPVVIEGDPPAVSRAHQLTRTVGGRPVTIPVEVKPLYHALCTISSSHVAALLLFCHDALDRLPPAERPLVWDGLIRLAQTTLDHVRTSPGPEAVTGPTARGDEQTVRRHLDELDWYFPDWAAVYRLLDARLRDRLSRKNPPAAGSEPGD